MRGSEWSVTLVDLPVEPEEDVNVRVWPSPSHLYLTGRAYVRSAHRTITQHEEE